MNEIQFENELNKIGIKLNEKQTKQLKQFLDLIIKENQKINLTRITQPDEIYLNHFYDSLTLIKTVDLNKELLICDIGSGAGIPGLVLKICFPNLKIISIEASLKKVKFQEKVQKSLKLTDFKPIHSRIEEYAHKNEEKFDLVIARAVAPLSVLLEISSKQLKIGQKMVFYKSNISQEILTVSQTKKKLFLKELPIIEFKLPVSDAQRTLVSFEKTRKTNALYPRAMGIIKKRPL